MSMGRRGKRASSLPLLLLLLLGAFAGGGYFVGRPAASAAAAQTKPAGKQPATSAKDLYAANCAQCHGADGRGQTPMGRALATPNLTDAGWWKKERPGDKRLTDSIRDGRNRKRMPAFGRQLSKSEIAALVRLVRAFDGK